MGDRQSDSLRSAGVPAKDPIDTPSSVFRRDTVLALGAPSLKNAIELTNNYIAIQHDNSNMFATVFFGLLNPSDATVLYINAGHEEPLIISNGTLKTRLKTTGPAVGMLPKSEFKVERMILAPGASLLIYADGVTDALNARNERFSDERLVATAVQSPGSAGQLLNTLITALDTHIAGCEQFDDITLLTVRRKSSTTP